MLSTSSKKPTPKLTDKALQLGMAVRALELGIAVRAIATSKREPPAPDRFQRNL
ncbi:MAG: hypothetical protein WBL95_24545 [Microcoleus sp.]